MDAVVLALRVVLALGVVLALLFVLHRKVSTLNGNRAGGQGPVSVVARQGIGPKASFVVLDADGKRFYLGVTEQAVSVLDSSTAPQPLDDVREQPIAPGRYTSSVGVPAIGAGGTRPSGRHASDHGTSGARALRRRVSGGGMSVVGASLAGVSMVGVAGLRSLGHRVSVVRASVIGAVMRRTPETGNPEAGVSPIGSPEAVVLEVDAVGTVAPGTGTADTGTSRRPSGASLPADDHVSDQVTPDQVTPDEVTADQATPDQVTSDEVTADQVTSDEHMSREVVADADDADFAAALRRALALPAPVREPAAPDRRADSEDLVTVPATESALNGSILSPETWKQTAAFLRQGRSR